MNQYPNEQAMLRFVGEIWPEIRRRVPDARLTIAGMNPTARLRSIAEDQPGVTVTGFVDDIRPVIGKQALYVCPMFDGGGTRLKLLDAMALACPIVATPMAMEGLDATDGDQVRISEFGPAFVDTVVELLGDPAARQALGRRAREWTEATYGWESIGNRLVRSYERAATSKTPA